MAKTLRYRLFKVGAMPESARAKIANEQVLFSDEGVRVIVRRRGTAPGFRGSGVGRFSGAFAITDHRIIANISKSVMVDASYDAKDSPGAEAALTEDGLQVKVDASVNPNCTGEIEMQFKAEFTKAQLDQFPKRQLRFRFPPELVPKIFGVPG
jgi:hypothetical protein